MVTELRAKEWDNLRTYARECTAAELKGRRDLERVLATVAKHGREPGPDIGAPGLASKPLSSALVAEALKWCKAEPPAKGLDAEAYHTGDGT